jgi:hypothetical protein
MEIAARRLTTTLAARRRLALETIALTTPDRVATMDRTATAVSTATDLTRSGTIIPSEVTTRAAK